MVFSLQIWASLEQSHPICTFLPSKAPWGPYGPLGVKAHLPWFACLPYITRWCSLESFIICYLYNKIQT